MPWNVLSLVEGFGACRRQHPPARCKDNFYPSRVSDGCYFTCIILASSLKLYVANCVLKGKGGHITNWPVFWPFEPTRFATTYIGWMKSHHAAGCFNESGFLKFGGYTPRTQGSSLLRWWFPRGILSHFKGYHVNCWWCYTLVKWTLWRCISYWKWGCSIAMLVY